MKRKQATLWLALLAALTASAIAAPAASAFGEDLFHTEEAHTILDVAGGKRELRITTNSAEPTVLSCKSVTGHATTTTATTEAITLTEIRYNGCERQNDGLQSHVRMRSCDYELTSKPTPHGPLHIRCTTAGDSIRYNGTFLGAEVGCLRIPAQTPTSGGVAYHNTGSGTTREVIGTVTVKGITYTEVGVCGENHTTNDAEWNTEFTVTGTNTAEEHVGVWHT